MKKSIKVRMEDTPHGVMVYPVCDDSAKFQALTRISGGQLSRPAIKIISELGYEIEVVSETLKGVSA